MSAFREIKVLVTRMFISGDIDDCAEISIFESFISLTLLFAKQELSRTFRIIYLPISYL